MIPNRLRIIYEVTKKELFEHFKTMRLLVIAIIFTIVFLIVAVYGNYLVGGIGDEPAYEEGPNTVLVMMLAISSLFPPILAIALSYDSIVGERTRRSLHLVLSKPVDRASIYIGKFLGSFLSIVIIYLVVGTIGYFLVIGLSGQIPSLKQVGNAYAAIGIILFSAACWVLFIMLFSTSFKTVTSTIIFSVLFWLFILSLISSSGFIYYMVTREQSSEPITIDINTSPTEGQINYTILSFTAHRFDSWVLSVDYEVKDENGTKITPFKSSGLDLSAVMPTFVIGPGKYTWNAKYQDTGEDSPQTIGEGSFIISEDFFPITSTGPSASTPEYEDHNDLMLYIGKIDTDSQATYDIQIISESNNSIIDQEFNYLGGFYFLNDLDEGDYNVLISSDNETYLETTIHSYGTKESRGGQLMDLFGSNEDMPDYVKYTSALNPDNCASVYVEILTGEASTGVYLNVPEAVTALTIIFVFLFILGMLVFSRIELL